MPVRLKLPVTGMPASWEKAATAAKGSPEMEEAVTYFRRVLGRSFWDKKGELARRFHLGLQGGPREWIRLYRLVRLLDDVPNVDKLVVRQLLGKTDWQQYIAGQQALEFCGRLHASGHRVEFIERYERAGKKSDTTPDVRVWLDDRPVIVEFKALQDPDEQKPWDELEEDLFCAFVVAGLDTSVLDVELRAPALRYNKVVVDALRDIARAAGSAAVDLPYGTGRAQYVGPRQEYPRWKTPLPQRDDVDRIRGKLGSAWVRQLRDVEEPTLVVALTEHLFAYYDLLYLAHDIYRVRDMLADEFPRRKMLSAILLHEESFLPPWQNRLVLVGDGARFVRDGRDGHDRAVLLVPNPEAGSLLTRGELEPLVGRVMKW